MITITKDWLLDANACDEGIEWFENNFQHAATTASEVLHLLDEHELFDWWMWLGDKTGRLR